MIQKVYSAFAVAAAVLMLGSTSHAEIVYVQSVKAVLKGEPQMKAAEVATVARGEELNVIAAKGSWLQVQTGDHKGWISKLFVNKNKPIGSATLADDAPVSEAKNSRRRESTYTVSAATRGLMPVERTRTGREEYRADKQALDKVEGIEVDGTELEKFQKDGKLTGL